MKKLLTLLLLFPLSFSLFSQTRPTNKVKKAFEAQYPQATDAKWSASSLSDGGTERVLEWRVLYQLDGVLHSTFYTNKGEWQITKYKIDSSELPDAILKAIRDDYYAYELVIAAKFESPESKGYEVWLDNGRDGFDVQYSAEGKMLLRTLTSVGYKPIDDYGNFIDN